MKDRAFSSFANALFLLFLHLLQFNSKYRNDTNTKKKTTKHKKHLLRLHSIHCCCWCWARFATAWNRVTLNIEIFYVVQYVRIQHTAYSMLVLGKFYTTTHNRHITTNVLCVRESWGAHIVHTIRNQRARYKYNRAACVAWDTLSARLFSLYTRACVCLYTFVVLLCSRGILSRDRPRSTHTHTSRRSLFAV